ncbi:hypothetical protein Salat_2474600 [Sesamum alatum]|uniref:Uncharacterized protein n=1 Tax=Sesamum alatum TaxID=300844 RepID=A0AAE1XS04_9LAMI|nr:hypothetical protein Salat_2474600 [Sesamum alatum]
MVGRDSAVLLGVRCMVTVGKTKVRCCLCLGLSALDKLKHRRPAKGVKGHVKRDGGDEAPCKRAGAWRSHEASECGRIAAYRGGRGGRGPTARQPPGFMEAVFGAKNRSRNRKPVSGIRVRVFCGRLKRVLGMYPGCHVTLVLIP